MSSHWPAIFEMLTRVTGVDLLTAKATPVWGGCIHQAFRVENNGIKFFLKLNTHDKGPMLAAEFDALQQLEKTQTLKVPEPIAHGVDDGFAWLVTEFLDLVPASVLAHEALGRQLAMLHNKPRPHFGWHRDNAIGLTLQINDVNAEWIPFFREKRIGWQLELARRDGYVFDGSERLMESMEVLFAGYEPSAALLHGDLWHGNTSMLSDERPVVFDPASYFGDPEAEFGIVEMFGGFSERFQDAYREIRPSKPDFEQRRHLYRLYHDLNHLHLFGAGYAQGCQKTIAHLLDFL